MGDTTVAASLTHVMYQVAYAVTHVMLQVTDTIILDAKME